MATIINITGSKALQISEETIANTLQIGSNWKWIRIGMLFNINSYVGSTSSLNSINFACGLCSGTNSLYGTVNGPTHFVGCVVPANSAFAKGDSGGTGLGTPYYYANPSLGNIIGKQIGTASFVPGLSNIGNIAFVATGSLAYSHGALYLDFIKNTNDTTAQRWTVVYSGYQIANNLYGSSIAIPQTSFYAYLSEVTTSAGLVNPPWRRDAILLPVSESIHGTLDSVNVYWNKQVPLHIAEIAVYRFQ